MIIKTHFDDVTRNWTPEMHRGYLEWLFVAEHEAPSRTTAQQYGALWVIMSKAKIDDDD